MQQKDQFITELEGRIEPESRRLHAAIRKIDFRILPLLIAGYFFNILDRNNIGYARIANAPNHTVDKTLNLTDFQAQTLVSVFFITYVILEVPSNIIMKLSSPAKWLSLLWICWGIATIVQGFCIGYGSLMAIRLFLGAFESGYFPGAIFYLTYWYPQKDMTLRIGLFNY